MQLLGMIVLPVSISGKTLGLLACIDGAVDEVGLFFLDPLRLILIDARRRLVAGIKPQPDVQQVALLD